MNSKGDLPEVDITERLYFYGTVKDNQGLVISNAIVLLLACLENGIEKPLGYTFTDQEGRYHIMSRLIAGHELVGYKLMASKLNPPGQCFNPNLCLKEEYHQPETDNTYQEIDMSLTEVEHTIDIQDLVEAGESESRCQPLVKEVTMVEENYPVELDNQLSEPKQEPIIVAAHQLLPQKAENHLAAMLFLLLLSLFGTAILPRRTS